MRDLSSEELTHVYGAGSRGKSPCPPSKPKSKSRCKSRGSKGSSSGGYSGRCGKGGSS